MAFFREWGDAGWFFAGRLRTDAKVESRLTDSSVLLLERPHESRSGCCPQKSSICIFCSNFYTFFKLLHNVLLTLLHTVLFKLYARSTHFCVPSRGHRQLSRPRPWPRKRMISHTDKSSGVVNSESLSNIFLKRMILHTQDTICHRCHRQTWYFVKYLQKNYITHTDLSNVSIFVKHL